MRSLTIIKAAHFEILPFLSSPYDMYAAAVLAARILLVNEENTLSIAADELLSLARQVTAGYVKEIPFARRLRATIDGDPRWISSLGPHRLTSYPEMLEMAARVVPTEL